MYSNLMDLSAASQVFHGMDCKDVISWTTMMSILVSLECASEVLKLFLKMIGSGIKYDAVSLVNLISASGLVGSLKMGRSIHAQAIMKGFASDLCVANSMIVMYSRSGELKSAKNMFDQMTTRSLLSLGLL